MSCSSKPEFSGTSWILPEVDPGSYTEKRSGTGPPLLRVYPLYESYLAGLAKGRLLLLSYDS